MKCRHCEHVLSKPFLDLGSAPPSNAYLRPDTLENPETWLPLKLMICEVCWLAQTLDFTGRENLFDAEYAYFSSCSASWLQHAQQFVTKMRQQLNLDANSLVVEIAANDGYLLQYVQAAGIPCLGIEPTTSTANAARAKGIPVLEQFFGMELAQELVAKRQSADLMVANNVLAHVPNINDFVSGFACLLKPDGVASFEFPHLLNMVQENQFDTAYHEHYSYLSLHAVQVIFEKNGLHVFDVQEWPTHGGSLRVLAQRSDTMKYSLENSVAAMLLKERVAGIADLAFYQNAQRQAEKAKFELLEFLLTCKKQGQQVVAYGAAAKGNTLLNFSGVRPDLLPYVIDINVHKQGKYLPGSRIPIVTETRLSADKPDYVLILPWNLRQEIVSQLDYVRSWGGKFVTAIPSLSIF